MAVVAPGPRSCSRSVGSSTTTANGVVYHGSLNGHMYAQDAATGEPLFFQLITID